MRQPAHLERRRTRRPLAGRCWQPEAPIYPSIVCLLVGAAASVVCRPDLTGKTLVGGGLFLVLYGISMLGLKRLARGYIEEVWNLPALSGVLIAGVPLEELLFAISFGMHWTGVYEHFAGKASLDPPGRAGAGPPGAPRVARVWSEWWGCRSTPSEGA